MAEDGERAFDWFELFVAILLGLGAVGGAWSAYQGDLWGGAAVEAYGEASTQATRASTVFNLGVTELMRDIQLDIDAKKLVAEGLFTDDPVIKARVYIIASYLYGQQMSDAGYRVSGLDPRYRTEAGREGIDHIPEPELASALERELAENDEYVNAMLQPGTDAFELANRRFDAGRDANEKGDQFAFIGVLYTVALFLAGIALVFKTQIRWGFAGLGALMLAYSTYLLFAAPWSGSEADAQAPENAPVEEAPGAAPDDGSADPGAEDEAQ